MSISKLGSVACSENKASVKLLKLSNFRILFLLAFVVLLGYEAWNKLSLFGGMTMPRLVGLLYCAWAFLSPKKMFSINENNRQPLFILFLLWWWLLFCSLITNALYSVEINVQFGFLQLIVLYWLITNEVANSSAKKNMVFFAFVLGVSSIYILITQGIGLQASKQGGGQEGIQNITRVWFMGLNPNSLGNLAALAFVLTLSLFFQYKNKTMLAYFLLLPLLTLPLLISESGSLGAFILLFLGVSSFFFLKKKGKKNTPIYLILGFAVVLALLRYFDGNEYLSEKARGFFFEGDLSGRTDIWKDVIELTSRSPLFGVGSVGRTAHNIFLDMFKLGGLPALSIFAYFCFYVFRRALIQFKLTGDSLSLVIWLCVIFILLKSGGALNIKYIWVLLALITPVHYIVDKPRTYTEKQFSAH